MKTFKKGSIVPRWMNIILTHNKKAQHLITFGMDVTFDGKSLLPAHKMGPRDCLIQVTHSRKYRNGFRLVDGWIMDGSRNPEAGEFNASITKKPM